MNTWATTIISGLVFVVAFLQWRTAHQKVVLDLFEKRLKVYNQARTAVSRVVTSGQVKPDSNIELGEAAEGATFLFGADVHEYLESLWRDFGRLHSLNQDLERGVGISAGKARSEVFERIAGFYKTGPELFGRYMRMDQRLLRTPSEWFTERNKLRLSHADNKQR